MKPNIASRLATDTPYLRDLITGVSKGEIKIPQFQRRFVWKEEQALSLLDSVSSNYPVGSLLLWRTDTKLTAERNIGDFRLPETDDLTPTDYVLDGQQRLTVIYSCFGAEESDAGFTASYDLDKEVFVRTPEEHHIHLFPLRILYNTTRLLDFRSGLMSHPNGQRLQSRLDALLDVLTKYKIPVVTLKDLTVEEVCPIFERINSSGTRLSTYDLMVAATWSESFDLNEETAAIQEALEPKGFDDIDGDTVLKCLAAVQKASIKKETVLDLRKLRRSEMDALVEKTKAAILRTVDLLTTEFGIYCWDFLPYEAVAIALTYIFSQKGTLSKDDVLRVRQWFWRSAFSERYRGASEHFISKDMVNIHRFVVDGQGSASSFGAPPDQRSLLGLSFRSNNSRSRAFILLLARRRPRNLTNGANIDCAEALSVYNRKQFHHVFPKAFLRRQPSPAEANSLMNICILAASENNAISDSDPSTYLPWLVANHGPKAESIFRSNVLPPPSQVDYSEISYQDFLVRRALVVIPAIQSLCNGDCI
ncbi:MAG: DUF262 domain-containing protein [Phycisphaerae bacterium]|nr:DUF262 domain-containing protein [Phycisphaerae bacterium]